MFRLGKFHLLMGVLLISAIPSAAQPANSGLPHHVRKQSNGEPGEYPYHSKQFKQFVEESYHIGKAGDCNQFYHWMEKAYIESPYRDEKDASLKQFLLDKRNGLHHMQDSEKRAEAEASMGAWAHRFVKRAIPHFSLDRGFEFTNVVSRGERQCFLQSVLIAGMLQEMGIDAGVVMVNRNIAGEETNNGHAITLVRLSDGQDLIVDASEPIPFVKHHGLFVGAGSTYLYVGPVYKSGSERILYFRDMGQNRKWTPAEIAGLDRRFLRSQFYYYRGERAVGGPLSANKTPNGLKESESYLRMSISLCPRNPLPSYLLGKVYLAMGDSRRSASVLQKADQLYERFGWVPRTQRGPMLTQHGSHKSI